MLGEKGQPLPKGDLWCINITLRNRISGVIHEAEFPLGAFYKDFFSEVRRLFGRPTRATSTKVLVTDERSGERVEGWSTKKLEPDLNGRTLLSRFFTDPEEVD